MTRASLAALRQTFLVEQPRRSEAEARALLVRVAKEGHARIMREQTGRAGIAPAFEAYANAPGRPVESVILPGPIVYRYRYFAEIEKVGLDMLRKASPVVSGAYRDSHVAIAETDGTRILTNPVPYARRIEIGKTESGRDFVVQVPNRIYERVARRLVQRYRNVAAIEFGYTDLAGAHVVKGALKGRYRAKGGTVRKRRQKAGSSVRAPAIFIRPVQVKAV